MFCSWMEPSGLVKATRDCQTLPSPPELGGRTIALVPRGLDSGWMLLALSNSLSNYAASLRPSPKEASKAPPGIREKQAESVSSGSGADSQAQNPKMSGTGDTRKQS